MTPQPALAAPPRWPMPPLVSASIAVHAAAAVAAPFAPAWALGAVVLNHALLTATGLWPRSTWLGPNVRRLPTTPRPAWALTIDDGPDPEVTPAVLDLLAEYGVKATFFCIAERARLQPKLLRRIVDAGHSVQNHSAHHRHHFSLFGPRALAREIATAQAVLGDLSGRRPHCFRAPAGLRNPMLDPVLHKLDLHLVSWTRRGFDTRDTDAGRVLQRLTRELAAGDILLVHDGHGAHTPQGPLVLSVLPPLLQRCRDAGLHAMTLAEALPPRHACTA